MGHSAGAHTAAFLALNHAFLEKFGANSANIVGLIGLSGPYALVPDSDALRAAFAAPFSEKDWQPIRFVDSHAPPALLLHGLSDKEVLPQETIELHDALVQEHVRVEMHLFPHRGHADTLAPFPSCCGGARRSSMKSPHLFAASARNPRLPVHRQQIRGA